jgi:hypothetical protein
MAKLTLEHQEEILTFPTDSILELKIEEANLVTVPPRNGNGEGWTKIEFVFKILGIQAIGDGGNPQDYSNWITRKIYGSVPARLTDSPENRLRIWAEAIFKQELGIGFELDTDMFIGRHVRGLTSQYDAKGRTSTGAPMKRHQIETLLPAGGGVAAAPQAPPQAAAPGTPAQQDPWGAAPAPAANDPWANTSWNESQPPF